MIFSEVMEYETYFFLYFWLGCPGFRDIVFLFRLLLIISFSI